MDGGGELMDGETTATIESHYPFSSINATLETMSTTSLDPFDVPEHAREPLATWLALITQWNARIDLTAARSTDELYDLMLADAIELARLDPEPKIPEGASVVDVGSGAGAPGLALAILRPDLRVTLVEPLTKRIAFLRTVLGTLGRSDIELVRDRIEPVLKQRPRGWDVAISRATLAPAAWLPLALELAPSAWALLAREEPPTLEGTELVHDITYTWPLTKASRRAIHLRRDTR
jgi:16S rRNA (guanine527-N7)-methyltransferase